MKRQESKTIRLEGTNLLLVRLLWGGAAVIALGYFAMLVFNVPMLMEINSARGFEPVSWVDHVVWWLRSDILHSSFIFLFFTVGATALFVKRNNERPAVFYSIMYLLLGIVPIIASESLGNYYQNLPLGLQFFRVAVFFIVSFVGQWGLYTYPDLKFSPGWTRHFIWGFVFVSGYYAIRYWMVGYGTLDMLFFVSVSVIGGVVAQLYRYRNMASDMQRQQIKWGAYSFATFIFFHIITIPVFQYIHNPANNIPVNQQFYWFAPLIILLTAGYVINLTMFFNAVVRYRLWDINILINRSLVYSSVTAVLVAVFAFAFFGLRSILDLFLSSLDDTVAVASASLLVATLFAPTRDRVRRFVDHRFFGIELDYREAVRLYERHEITTAKHLQPKTKFAKYKKIEMLGRGGMGEVYKAFDDSLDKLVAIKMLMQNELVSEELENRFEREAEAISQLDHPNIVKLLEFGEFQNVPYMVMEYVDGKSLNQALRDAGSFSLEEALPWLQQIAGALDHAHEMNIIHRDVKLSNIMLEDINGVKRAVLTDFGIARLTARETKITKTGRMMGTLDYISPEQISGASAVDHHADIYSLGVVAFKLLTGRLPFDHSNPGALVLAHMLTPAPDPRDFCDMPEVSAVAVLRSLSKAPEERFDSGEAFIKALAEGLPS